MGSERDTPYLGYVARLEQVSPDRFEMVFERQLLFVEQLERVAVRFSVQGRSQVFEMVHELTKFGRPVEAANG